MDKFKNLNINVIAVSVIALVIAYIPNKKSDNKINIEGICSKRVLKDKFTMNIDIKNLAKDSSVAVNKSLVTYKSVFAKLKEVKNRFNSDLDIETNDYSIREKLEYNNKLGKEVKVGVESIIGFNVTTSNSESLVSILNILKDYKDVYTDNFANIVSHKIKKEAKDSCLKDAILDAKLKAEKIATATNQKVGKLTYVFINNRDIYENRMSKSANLMKTMDTSLDTGSIFSGAENITVNVSATFELN